MLNKIYGMTLPSWLIEHSIHPSKIRHTNCSNIKLELAQIVISLYQRESYRCNTNIWFVLRCYYIDIARCQSSCPLFPSLDFDPSCFLAYGQCRWLCDAYALPSSMPTPTIPFKTLYASWLANANFEIKHISMSLTYTFILGP